MRVWSWLRMNAGGVLNTCKSNERRLVLALIRSSGGRVSNAWVTCLIQGDSSWKRLVKPHKRTVSHDTVWKHSGGMRWTRVWLASWWGNGLPRRRSVAGLRGWTATLGLRHGPNSYGRQQWGILHNGGNPDAATPREGRRPSGCKLLLPGAKEMTVPGEKATANYVPAAAVIRREQALSGFTGCKGCVGGFASQMWNLWAQPIACIWNCRAWVK